MKVGVICGFSGVVRDVFLRRGDDAVLFDLLLSESPGLDRWKERSRMYPGVAEAVVDQWGGIVVNE